MNFPIDYLCRLVDRGGAGLSCDARGVTLGSAELARVHLEEGRVPCFEVRSLGELGQVLKAAYGPQSDAVVQRLHRGLRRTAAWLEAGDLCQAGVEAVMLGFPDLTPTAVAKLAELADLEKRGGHWKDEPRLPGGQAGGGQWTTNGGGGATAPVDSAVAPPLSAPAPVLSPSPPPPADPAPTLDDGVYRPGADSPRLIQIGGPPEETDEEPSYRSNGGPPLEVEALQEMFPGLKDHPLTTAIIAPLDHFVGFSSIADEMSLAATMNLYRSLVAQIKAIDPHFVDYELFPSGGAAGMSWEWRANLINDLLMKRASALYKLRYDPRQLQVETLKFLRNTVDAAYAKAVEEFRAKGIKIRPSDNIGIGKIVDKNVRNELKGLYNRYGIDYGKDKNITINNRDYNRLPVPPTYRVPDARVGNIAFDWTIGLKTAATRQVIDFFDADSKPAGVVIVVPTQIYKDGAYYIPRPPTARKYSYASPI